MSYSGSQFFYSKHRYRPQTHKSSSTLLFLFFLALDLRTFPSITMTWHHSSYNLFRRGLMCLSCERAYVLRVSIVAPFRNEVMTLQMEEFNKCMSSVWVSVEWLVRDVIQYVRFIELKKILSLLESCLLFIHF